MNWKTIASTAVLASALAFTSAAGANVSIEKLEGFCSVYGAAASEGIMAYQAGGVNDFWTDFKRKVKGASPEQIDKMHSSYEQGVSTARRNPNADAISELSLMKDRCENGNY